MAASARPANNKPQAETTEKAQCFIVNFDGKPALEVRWLSDAVFQHASERINEWIEEASDIERDELNDLALASIESGCSNDEIDAAVNDYLAKVESCVLHSQSPAQARAHIRSALPQALEDLLTALIDEAYHFISYDDGRCLFPEHRKVHRSENRIILEELDSQVRMQLRRRLNIWDADHRGGGKARLLRGALEKQVRLAREYENLLTDKSHGDRKDKALWEIICNRFDNDDSRWRERAKLDQDDVPDTVLDLVPQRRRLKLKTSHLALYHAASRANIDFSVSYHSRTGQPFIKPSPRTLVRRIAEATPTNQRRREREPKRMNERDLIAESSPLVS